MNPVQTPSYLSEYYGSNNVMVLSLASGNYEVHVTIQGDEVVVSKFEGRLYEDATRYKAVENLILRRINRKITAITG